MSVLSVLLIALLQDPAPAGPPPREEVQSAREALRDTYKDQYGKAQPEFRVALARRMMGSFSVERNPALRLALLLEVIDLATGGNDLATASAALEELSKTPGLWPGAKFKVLELQEKKDRPGALAESWVALSGDAIDGGDYDLAVKTADKAEVAAGRRKEPALIEQVRELRDQARLLQREYKAVEESSRKLRETPDDPAANEAMGRFWCFLRGDWEKGLPFLARSLDATLRSIAETDRATKTDAPGMVKTGDLWWDWAEKQGAKPVKETARSRASKWYEQAMIGLIESERSRVEKRVRTASESGGGGPAGNVALARNGATITGGSSPELLIDGVTTGYTPGAGFAFGAFPVEFIVTLPKVLPLRMIRLLLWDGDNRFYRFALETSSDGRTFTPLIDRSQGEWRSWQTMSFPPRRVKAIKLKGLYNSSNGNFHAVELEAYCRPPVLPPEPRGPSPPK